MSRTAKTPAQRAQERHDVAKRMYERAQARRDAAYQAYRDADDAHMAAQRRLDHTKADPDLPEPLRALDTEETA